MAIINVLITNMVLLQESARQLAYALVHNRLLPDIELAVLEGVVQDRLKVKEPLSVHACMRPCVRELLFN